MNFFIVQAALIHEWQFNELTGTNLSDSIGGVTAQIVVLPGGGSFQLDGNALRLDGGARTFADYVRFPDNLFDGLTNVTIEIWAAPHSFPNWGRVLDISPGDNPATDNFRLSFSNGVDGNQQRMGLRPLNPFDSALPTEANKLYHYVIVWSATGGASNGGCLDWYRDGTLVGGHDTGGTNISRLANLPQTFIYLGRSATTADSTANASFHAMRIHDTALTEQEILLQNLKGANNDGPDNVEGLIHRWNFSGTNGLVIPDSISGANGQVVVLGATDFVFANGQLRLAGGAKDSTDYAAMPSGLLDGLSNVTIEAWVTPLSAQNWARIFDFGAGNGSIANTFLLSMCRATSLNVQRMEFQPYTVDTALATAPGQQYHYVVTWDATGATNGGGRLQWYRDGVLAGGIDTGATTGAAVDDAVLWIGRSQYPDDTAHADFNELRIYNRALSPAEINFNRLNGPDNFNLPPPVAVDDAMTLNPGAMALIPVLNNDDGAGMIPGSVQIISPPSAGTTQIKADGKILYAHNGSSGAQDQFTYTVQNSVGKTSNVATVTLTLSPSLRLPNTTLAIPNSPPPVAYEIVDAFPNLFFEDVVALRTPPGVTNQIFMVERRGIISYVPDIHAANPVRQVFLDISNQVRFDNTAEGEMGLLGMAFHPGFASNGTFFVFYMAPPAPATPFFNRVSRFTANPATLTVNTNTQQILFSVIDQDFNHNGGDLHFGPDNYLYISMGDEGSQYNFRDNAQRIDKDFYSGILRIDVDKKPGSIEPTARSAIPTNASGQAFYSIPSDNPFVGATSLNGQAIHTNTLRAEFFAIGFRHPWRFSFDAQTGELWAGDVGQDRFEEVNIVTSGGNYGWAFFEGTELASTLYPGQSTITTPPPGFTSAPPLYQYAHSGGDPQFAGRSISGGVVYRGNRIAELNGAYLFADFETAHIWALRRTNSSVVVQRIGSDSGVASFGVDPSNGDVLIANYLENKVKRLVQRDAVNSEFPAKLSDTGIFADLATLTPNPGIVSYEPIVAFWSDYAIKRRWFATPDLTSEMTFSADDNWTFPTGMKWFKHFDLELQPGNPASKHRLETRVLVKTETGSYGVSYKWNNEQTEAFLVGDGGTNFFVTVQDGTNVIQQQWEVPSRAACLICHTPSGGHALSFNTRQMNHAASLNDFHGNQIALLSNAGYFANSISNPHTLPAFASANDENASLEYRVRSYLAVNCVQCHQPGGAGPSSWDARAQLTLAQTRLLNGLLENDGANPANRLVVSGDTNHSVLLRRIQGDGFTRMPPLGTHQLDWGAINLLTRWINELTNRQDFTQWQIAHFGFTNNPLALADADPDEDGANNYYEFLTMTSPFDNEPPPWSISIDNSAGNVDVSFLRLANRGFLVESSADLIDWSPWNVRSNQIFFGASNVLTTLSAPRTFDTNQFFRVRIFEP